MPQPMKIRLFPLFVFLLFACKNETPKINQSQYPEKPNIVWIVCEDLSPEHLETYGGTGGKTPFLNALAAESVQYNQVFATAGVCAPSRAALITGAYQTSIGAMHMRTLAPSAAAGDAYPTGFKGYSTVLPEGMKTYPELLRMDGYYTSNNSKEDYQFKSPVTMWDESSPKAHYRNRHDPNQPFFAIFNFTISHESQVWMREKEELLVDPKIVKVPPVYPDDSVTRSVLAELRKAHEDWIAEFGDLGALNEMEMVRNWWGGKDEPPITLSPEVKLENGKVKLNSATSSASIPYRKSKNVGWKVYLEPFEGNPGDSLYVNAHRIGFEPSENAQILK